MAKYPLIAAEPDLHEPVRGPLCAEHFNDGGLTHDLSLVAVIKADPAETR
jgi:hypothetical protein